MRAFRFTVLLLLGLASSTQAELVPLPGHVGFTYTETFDAPGAEWDLAPTFCSHPHFPIWGSGKVQPPLVSNGCFTATGHQASAVLHLADPAVLGTWPTLGSPTNYVLYISVSNLSKGSITWGFSSIVATNATNFFIPYSPLTENHSNAWNLSGFVRAAGELLSWGAKHDKNNPADLEANYGQTAPRGTQVGTGSGVTPFYWPADYAVLFEGNGTNAGTVVSAYQKTHGQVSWTKLGATFDTGVGFASPEVFFWSSTGASNKIQDFALSARVVAEPLNPASNIVVSALNGDRMTIAFAAGQAWTRRLVVAKEGGAVDRFPEDGLSYAASSVFTNAVDIGNGNRAVYADAGTQFTLTGLTPTTTYHIAVFEVDGRGVYSDYLTNTFPTASQGTLAAEPTFPASALLVSGLETNALTLEWTAGDGEEHLVIARQGTSVTVLPADGNTYSANSDFSLAPDLGGGNRMLYRGNGGFAASGLTPGTTYTLAVIPLNGSAGAENYLTSSVPAVTVTTPVPEPAVQVADLRFTRVEARSVTLAWTPGDGASRLLLGRKGSPVSMEPLDGVGYTAGAVFGTGTNLGDGTFALHAAGGSGATITGLDPTSTYYFAAHEYNGADAAANYLLGGAPSAVILTLNDVAVQDFDDAGTWGYTPDPAAYNASGSTWTVTNAVGSITNAASQSRFWGLRELDNPYGGGTNLHALRFAPFAVSPATNYMLVFNHRASAFTNVGAVLRYKILYDGGTDWTNGAYTALAGNNGAWATESIVLPAAIDTVRLSLEAAAFGSATQAVAAWDHVRLTEVQVFEPTVQSSALLFDNLAHNSVRAQWTPGNGVGRIVVVRQGNPVNWAPTDGMTYTANAAFNAATDLGDGNKVVFAGAGSSLTITGLAATNEYHVRVYEYLGTGPLINYLLSGDSGNPASVTTLAAQPSTHPSGILFTFTGTNELALAWTPGNATRHLVVAREEAPVAWLPQDGLGYVGETNWPAAPDVGDGNRIAGTVEAGTNGLTMVGLGSNTTYHFLVIGYNGDGLLANYYTNGTLPRAWKTTFGPDLATNDVPVWWLKEHGWSNEFDQAALSDTDMDRLDAWEEYIAGTSPTNGGSTFAVSNLEVAAGTVLQWPSVDGRVYAIHWVADLTGTFAEVTNDLPATVPLNVYTDDTHAAEAVGFYRIQVRQAD